MPIITLTNKKPIRKFVFLSGLLMVQPALILAQIAADSTKIVPVAAQDSTAFSQVVVVPASSVAQVVTAPTALVAPATSIAPTAPATSIAPTAPTSPATSVNESKADVSKVEFITPQSSQAVEFTYSGTIPLNDDRHLLRMKTTNFNHSILEELRQRFVNDLQVDGTVLSSLSIVGYGAPAGNWQRNESQAAVRGVDLKHYLMGTEMGGGALNVSWVSEDWDSLLTLIEHSHLVLRYAAADIIRNVEVPDGRERQLMMLGNGTFYRTMQTDLCPSLWRMEWKATLRRTIYNTTSGLIKIDSGRKVLSLSDLYELACRFPKGSDDFCSAVDFCWRCYPDNDVAVLNAAAAEIVRGNLDHAEELLKPYHSDPRAYNNIGVLCLLRGNRDRAAIYLNLASASGSATARKLLSP